LTPDHPNAVYETHTHGHARTPVLTLTATEQELAVTALRVAVQEIQGSNRRAARSPTEKIFVRGNTRWGSSTTVRPPLLRKPSSCETGRHGSARSRTKLTAARAAVCTIGRHIRTKARDRHSTSSFRSANWPERGIAGRNPQSPDSTRASRVSLP